MSDTSTAQDKNLPASERKLEKAREEGQVARSRDLGHFAAIAAGIGLIAAAGPFASAALTDRMTSALRFDRSQALGDDAMVERLSDWTLNWALAAVPFGLAMACVAVAAGLAMSGIGWTWKPMTPRLAALNPIAGIGRVFSKQQLIDAIKASVLALVLVGIGAAWLANHAEALVGVLASPLPAAIATSAAAIAGGIFLLVIALAAFAAFDVPLQKRLHANRLKMSHQELKQELKELEGNAEVKSKVRTRMREMTRRRMLAAVPHADLVVMNPSHYAVALRYDEQTMAAPKVVAKGLDLLAMKIRDVARDADVPVLEAPVLARALHAHTEIDGEVPAALFAAVAQVLAYVYQLRAALSGRGLLPGELPMLEVPRGFDPHERVLA